jgi:hypothetical protein
LSDANIFDAILGTESIKWDAFWHLFEWLLDEEKGHGLGNTLSLQLQTFAFGKSNPKYIAKREYPVSEQTDGKGKWTDYALGIPMLTNPTHLIVMDDLPRTSLGGQRKLDNLNLYIQESLKLRPNAIVRAVVISDKRRDAILPKIVFEKLRPEATDFTSQHGWRLLPLHTLGEWIEHATNGKKLSTKMQLYLADLVEWCQRS